MKLRDRARKLFNRDTLSEHTVCATRVDHAVFRDLRKRAPKIDETVTTPPTLPNGEQLDPRIWERLSEDIWTEYFGDDEPDLRQRQKIDQRFKVNRELADKQMRDETFRDTRSMTRGQILESAIATKGALESLGKSYGDELAEHGERENRIAADQDELDNIDDMLEHLRELRREGDPGGLTTEDIDDKIREAAKRKRGVTTALAGQLQEQAQHAGDLIDAARKAASAAAESASEAVEVASLLPGKDAGPRRRVSPDLMIEFANRVGESQTLRKVLDLMGRLELSMGTVRRQMRRGGYEEMVDIEMGADLRLVLPQEKMLVMHPVGRKDFFRRYTERSLMQYEMWSEQELKKGPLIFGADGSDSMRGLPNEFCRGLTLAACGIGNREGRNTAAIEFGSTGELREFWFPGDKPLDTATALDFAEHFFAGGTDINQVLLRAHDMIKEEAPFHSADLVIVTDGGDYVTESTIVLRDRLREMGVKIHGIAIGIPPTPYLLTVCDNTSSVFDFAGPNPTSDRLAIDIS